METTIKTAFNAFLERELNKPQYQAATQKDGALLVIAGAGSGKTRVITSRIANLVINENVPPYAIIALTFTNKAAGEMKHRLQETFGNDYKIPFIGTFHSFCLLQLRMNRHLLPNPDFSILDGDDQLSLVTQIVKKNHLEKQFTPAQLVYQISQLKNKLYLDPLDSDGFTHPRVKDIYLQYESDKAKSCYFDFDDLILNVLDLFKKNKTFKANFQDKVHHLLVDEYQDTSKIQHELLKEMALNTDKKFALDSLCAVGDEDQSIYSWRGATVTNMLKVNHDFAPVTTVKIEQNYRSVKPILQAANDLITNNKLRNPKELWSDKKGSNRIMLAACRSGSQEAEVIATAIKALSGEKKLRDIAILYRTHYQSRLIEEALIHGSIPYKIVGGIRFYERKEIKDLLAYMRLLINPFDRISLLRIINYPLRGLGQRFEDMLLQEWQQNPLFNFRQRLEHVISAESDSQLVTPAKQKALEQFLDIYAGLSSTLAPSKVIDEILKRTEYTSQLRSTLDAKDAEMRLENIRELVTSINVFEQTFKGHDKNMSPDDPFYISSSQPTLENFLYEVALMQEKIEEDDQRDQVSMMTLHAAKGLEFDVVVIAGLEEEILPSGKSLNTNEELEEERRLFYVGMTRAREYLLLTCASYRNKYGLLVDQVASRFLGEISEKLIQKVDVEKLHMTQVKQQLAKWLGLKNISSGMFTFGAFPYGESQATSPTTSYKSSTNHSTRPVKKTSTYAAPTAKSTSDTGNASWRKNQQVRHKKFGIGIITEVEKASGDDYYITAIFKAGPKKILSSFLEK